MPGLIVTWYIMGKPSLMLEDEAVKLMKHYILVHQQIDGGWGIEAWVTNLTDEVTRGVTFSTTLRSGSRSAFPQEPRMYGVTLRGEF